jgi:hypothetical protein
MVTHTAVRSRCGEIDVSKIYEAGTPIGSEVAYALDVEAGTSRIIGSNLGRRYGALGANEIPGTTDIELAAPDGWHVILDGKAGFLGAKPGSQQMRIQGLASAWARRLDRVRIGVLRMPEDGRTWVSTIDLDDMDLDAIAYETKEAHRRIRAAQAAVAAGRTPDVTRGPWCRFCPAFSVCPDKVSLARAMVTAPPDAMVAERIAAMSPADAGRAWDLIHDVEKVVKEAKAAIRERLELEGTLPLPYGRELRLEVTRPRTIDVRRALPVLQERFGKDRAEQLVEKSISVEAIEEAVKETKPPQGYLKKSIEAVMAALEAADAVTRARVTKPMPRKAET